MTARLVKTPAPERPDLKALMERVRNLPPMTSEQIDAQRKSWVIGEMMLEHPEITREQAEVIYAQASP